MDYQEAVQSGLIVSMRGNEVLEVNSKRTFLQDILRSTDNLGQETPKTPWLRGPLRWGETKEGW